MEPEKFGEIQGIEMYEEGITSVLHEQGIEVLSLTDGEEAYGVPVSFGYDGAENLYKVFLRVGVESKKERFAEQTHRASLTTYDVSSKHDWRSVIVSGSFQQISADEWDNLRTAIEDNAWYPSLFSEVEPTHDIQGWKLQIEESTGQQSPDAM